MLIDKKNKSETDNLKVQVYIESREDMLAAVLWAAREVWIALEMFA